MRCGGRRADDVRTGRVAAYRTAVRRDTRPTVQPRAGCRHALARALHLLPAAGAHYLTYFARALAATAARAPDNDALIQLAGSAREAVVVERALHEGSSGSTAYRRPRLRPPSRP